MASNHPRTDEALGGRLGRVMQFLAMGSRPIVKIDIDGEDPTMLYVEQAQPTR
jgi:hypothetical protein